MSLQLQWKDFDFVDTELSALDIKDGKYVIRTTTHAPLGNFYLMKTGKVHKIYLIKKRSGEKIVYMEYIIKNGELIIKNHKKPINDVITSFLLEKCPEIEKIIDIANFQTDEEIEDIDEEDIPYVVGKTKISKKGERKPKDRLKKKINYLRMLRMKGRNFPVKGYIQSGKTKFMINTAVWFLLNGKSSLIVVRNYTDDSDQLKARISSFTKELYDCLEHYGYDKNVFTVEYTDENKIDADSINGTNPKIMISICNANQLHKINEKITNNEKGKFVLFIDEADLLHKDVEETESSGNGELTSAAELQKLYNSAFCSFSVSGTILDSILKNNIKVEDLIVLKKPASYKGHNQFLIEHLKKKCKFATKQSEDVVENDENMIPFLNRFRTLEPFMTLSRGQHPRYCLMRVSKVKQPMNRLFDFLNVNYPDIASMIYNGDETKLFHETLMTVESIRLSNGRISKNENGVHVFKKGATPSYILEWLKNYGGVSKFSHIITLAGDLASRGISFGSADWGRCDLPWHLTDMYSTFAKCTDLPEFLQITGRLCIVCTDGVPLTLHITPEDHDNLLKGYNITEEFVHRAMQQDNSVNVKEYVENLNIFKKKLPKRDLTKEVKFKVNTVNTLEEDTRNGGWVTDDKGLYILKKITTVDNKESVSVLTSEGTVLEGVEVAERDDEITEEEIAESREEVGVEEYERLRRIFSKWSTGDSKIAIFMKNLDPNKKYTETEMKSLCENNIKRISLVMNKNFANASGWGKIIQKKNNKYRLQPCLVETFKQYFNYLPNL
jgi:hypothetical protein